VNKKRQWFSTTKEPGGFLASVGTPADFATPPFGLTNHDYLFDPSVASPSFPVSQT